VALAPRRCDAAARRARRRAARRLRGSAVAATGGIRRVYAAYARIFLVGAIAWGWLVDRETPDRFDLIGGAVVLVGALVILLGRRVA